MHRPAFQRLLDRIDEGRVNQVVVYQLDRLTRSVRDWAHIRAHFIRKHVGLVVVSGALQMHADALSNLQLSVLATLAEFEREMIAERLRDARAARRAHGLRSAGRITFGYASNQKTRQLVIEPSEAAVVTRAFMLAASGLSPSEIARRFNKEPRLASAPERHWIARTVLRLLRNKTYLGRLPDGAVGVHAPIISQELFDQAARVLAERSTRGHTPPTPLTGADPFLLRGLLVCSQCGKRMTTTSSHKVQPLSPTRRGRPQSQLYYRCRGESPCPGSNVTTAFIHARLIELMARPPDCEPPLARNLFMHIARIWPQLLPTNRRFMLEAHLERVVWYPAFRALRPVLLEDLRTLALDPRTHPRDFAPWLR